jgi:hypothetical protein
MSKSSMSPDPLTHVPVAAGLAYIERIQRLPSKFTATLAGEPGNRFSLSAVVVLVNGEKVGYLPADLSRRYHETVKAGTCECPGRRAAVATLELSGVELLLDLSNVPCGSPA